METRSVVILVVFLCVASFGCSDGSSSVSPDATCSPVDGNGSCSSTYDASMIGCLKDTDCKGERICENWRCVDRSTTDAGHDASLGDSGSDSSFHDALNVSDADSHHDGGDEGIYISQDTGDDSGLSDADIGYPDVDGGVDSGFDASTDGGLDGGNSIDVTWKRQLDCVPGRLASDGDDNIYFPCESDTSYKFYSYSSSGSCNWSYDLDLSVLSKKPFVLSNGNVVVDSGTKVLAFSKTGYLWTYDSGSAILSSVREVSQNGMAIVKYRENDASLLLDISNLSGKNVLEKQFGAQYSNSPSYFFDADDKSIFIGEDNILYSLDITTGGTNWSIEHDGSLTSPKLNMNGEIVVFTYRGTPSLWIHAKDGSVKLSLDLNYLLSTVYVLDPVIDYDNTMYSGSAYPVLDKSVNKVISVSYGGTVNWEYDVKAQSGIYAISLTKNGELILSSPDGVLYSLSRNGKDLWQYYVGDPVLYPVIELTDGSVVFGSKGKNLYRVVTK